MHNLSVSLNKKNILSTSLKLAFPESTLGDISTIKKNANYSMIISSQGILLSFFFLTNHIYLVVRLR